MPPRAPTGAEIRRQAPTRILVRGRAPWDSWRSVPSSDDFSSDKLRDDFYQIFGKESYKVLEEISQQAASYGYPKITGLEQEDGIATVHVNAAGVEFDYQSCIRAEPKYKPVESIFRR